MFTNDIKTPSIHLLPLICIRVASLPHCVSSGDHVISTVDLIKTPNQPQTSFSKASYLCWFLSLFQSQQRTALLPAGHTGLKAGVHHIVLSKTAFCSLPVQETPQPLLSTWACSLPQKQISSKSYTTKAMTPPTVADSVHSDNTGKKNHHKPC